MQKKAKWFKKLIRTYFQRKEIVKNIFLGSMLLITTAAYADIAVIVNDANRGVSLKRTDVQAIFLGISTKLPNGQVIVPYDEPLEHENRQSFYKLVAGKTPIEMKTYWLRVNFTGRGTPPVALPSESSVIAKVASDRNAISYVNAAAAKEANVSVAFLIPTE